MPTKSARKGKVAGDPRRNGDRAKELCAAIQSAINGGHYLTALDRATDLQRELLRSLAGALRGPR